ncbi:MAG: hypothetical protein NTU94_03855 [Planctomycetota bacterium]|nr:hypothetical protein [Planctomycetota bacterium]
MAKHWHMGYAIDPEIERFTVGEDYMLDRDHVRADVLGSAAQRTCMCWRSRVRGESHDHRVHGRV